MFLTRVPLVPEVPKTDKNFEERLIFKAFLLKFVNAYTPIFYVAFFKGRWVTKKSVQSFGSLLETEVRLGLG